MDILNLKKIYRFYEHNTVLFYAIFALFGLYAGEFILQYIMPLRFQLIKPLLIIFIINKLIRT